MIDNISNRVIQVNTAYVNIAYKALISSFIKATLGILLLLSSIISFASIEVSLLDQRVFHDRSFNLLISVKSDIPINIAEIKNLELLYDDFEVIGSQSNQQTILNDNVKTYELELSLELVLKNELEQISIPQMQYYDSISKEIQIPVIFEQRAISNPIKISTFLSKSSAYVQEAFDYTIFIETPLTLSNASLSKLNMPNAIAIATSQNREITLKNNIEHEVLRIKYTIFPQKTGELNIPEQVFTASVPFQANYTKAQTDVLGKTISYSSKSSSIRIEPPAYLDSYWLPVKNIEVFQRWENLNSLQLGDSFSQEITLLFDGLLPSQIPDGILSNIQNPSNLITAYPEKIEKTILNDDDSIITKVVQKINYVVSGVGNIELPVYMITVWDTRRSIKEDLLISRGDNNYINISDNDSNNSSNTQNFQETSSQSILIERISTNQESLIDKVSRAFLTYSDLFTTNISTGEINFILFIVVTLSAIFYTIYKIMPKMLIYIKFRKKYINDEKRIYYDTLFAIKSSNYLKANKNLLSCYALWTNKKCYSIDNIVQDLDKNNPKHSKLFKDWETISQEIMGLAFKNEGNIDPIATKKKTYILYILSQIRKIYISKYHSSISGFVKYIKNNDNKLQKHPRSSIKTENKISQKLSFIKYIKSKFSRSKNKSKNLIPLYPE